MAVHAAAIEYLGQHLDIVGVKEVEEARLLGVQSPVQRGADLALGRLVAHVRALQALLVEVDRLKSGAPELGDS